ncbi:MAG TPA: PAS domain S-box protein [Nitrospira sp.]|nr:PAS domain S-box protein [Nitrospira sp.]
MRILLIEDNPGDVRLLRERLAEGDTGRFELTHVDRLSAGLERLVETSFDVVLLDLSLPDSHGPDTVFRIRATSDRMPIVVLTGVEDEMLGLQLIQSGVQDYLVKGQVTGPLLTRSLRYAVERVRMEEILRESEARFRAIMDNSPTLMFLKDVEGRYLLVNRRFEEVFHLMSRDLIGKTDEEIFPAAQAEAFRADDRKVLEGGAPMKFEEVTLDDDGLRTSIVVKFPLLNAQGRCSGLCGIATDITERKRAESALQKAQRKLRQTLQASNTGLWDWNTVTNEVEFTLEWKRQLGYEDHEIAGRFEEWEARLHPEDKERALAYVRAYVEKPEGEYTLEFRLRHKDGSYRWIAARASFALEPDGRRVHLLGSHMDITDRKRAEEQLQRTLGELRTLSRKMDVVREEERTRIARELHDELGVRLTCLKLDLARLQSLAGGSQFPRAKMKEKVHSMMADIDSTIASVQRLVVELRPGILDDLGLVAAIEWQCQDFERRSGTPCVCKASQEKIVLDGAHATAAFRICQEALTNVARHAKARSVRVLIEQVNGELLLEIQDDGQGIRTEQLTESASSGLLGMCERARGLGGRLAIAGQPGKGTTVALRLPLT